MPLWGDEMLSSSTQVRKRGWTCKISFIENGVGQLACGIFRSVFCILLFVKHRLIDWSFNSNIKHLQSIPVHLLIHSLIRQRFCCIHARFIHGIIPFKILTTPQMHGTNWYIAFNALVLRSSSPIGHFDALPHNICAAVCFCCKIQIHLCRLPCNGRSIRLVESIS